MEKYGLLRSRNWMRITIHYIPHQPNFFLETEHPLESPQHLPLVHHDQGHKSRTSSSTQVPYLFLMSLNWSSTANRTYSIQYTYQSFSKWVHLSLFSTWAVLPPWIWWYFILGPSSVSSFHSFWSRSWYHIHRSYRLRSCLSFQWCLLRVCS